MDSTMLVRGIGFFNPDKQKFRKVYVYGAGSVGSHIVYLLAKIGAKGITVIDFDKVEEPNIGNQFYKINQIGMKKVEAIKQNIKEFTGINISIQDRKLVGDDNLDVGADTIHIMTFDNIKARKIVFEQLKGFLVTMIDARAGGQAYEVYEVNMADEEQCIKYEQSLEGKFSDAECGLQTVAYNVASLAAEVVSQFKKINNNEENRKTKFIREMAVMQFLAGKM
jgi:sulfur carrier protein ThiS adenylyltransferase